MMSSELIQDMLSLIQSSSQSIAMAVMTGQSIYPLITTLVVVPYIMTIVKKLVDKWNNKIKELVVEEGLAELVIENEANHANSDCYVILSRYINDNVQKENPFREFVRTNGYTMLFVPQMKDGEEMKFEWKDKESTTHEIFAIHQTLRKDEKQKDDKKQIVLSAKKLSVLKSFIKEIVNKENQTKQNPKHRPQFIWDSNRCMWNQRQIEFKKDFDVLFMRKDTKEKLKNDIDKFLCWKAKSERLGVPYKRGYLLYGPPGTGKTSSVYAVSEKLNRPVWFLNLSRIKNDKELENALTGVMSDSILVLDEIDTAKVTHQRDYSGDGDEPDYEEKPNLGTLLKILDGYNCLNDVIIFMITNYPEKLDSALIRPGRVDMKIEFHCCNSQQLEDMVLEIFGEIECIEFMKNFDRDAFDEKQLQPAEVLSSLLLPNYDDWKMARAAILKEIHQTENQVEQLID